MRPEVLAGCTEAPADPALFSQGVRDRRAVSCGTLHFEVTTVLDDWPAQQDSLTTGQRSKTRGQAEYLLTIGEETKLFCP